MRNLVRTVILQWTATFHCSKINSKFRTIIGRQLLCGSQLTMNFFLNLSDA